MLVTTLEADNYLGRVLTGRIESGVITTNRQIKVLNRQGEVVEKARVTKLLAFRGLARVPVDRAEAGDIVAIAGLQTATVADTLCDPSVEEPIPANPIDPPTLAMTISVNDSPVGRTRGRQGAEPGHPRPAAAGGGRQCRLEGHGNRRGRLRGGGPRRVAAGRPDRIHAPRGFRAFHQPRPGSCSRPRDGERLEPIEEVTVDVDDAYTGVVIEKISNRKGEMVDMRPTGAGKTRIVFHAPARGLIGYHGEFLTDTRGTGVMNRMFLDYAPHKGPVGGRINGVLISTEDGEAVAYGLWYLEERGKLFVTPGTKVYQGMIIGQNAKDNDLDVNPTKAKQLTNIRTTSKDEAVRLTPIVPMTLEQAMAYIQDDELVEVTPQNIRLRKRELLPHLRKRAKQAANA